MDSHDFFRYGLIASSYLIANLSESELKRVRSVLFFGSAARHEGTEESDVDIFFDVVASQKFQTAMRAKINKAAEEFYLSNAALEFKSHGIGNELSIKIGKLDKWEGLAQNMASHGVVVYGSYTKKPPGIKSHTIISWESIGKSKGAVLNKIYGYKSNGKRYPGLLEKNNGIKLGGSVIMIPSETRDFFIDLLKKYKVNYSRYDIWT
jgi:predicted nucleotidyltransferase